MGELTETHQPATLPNAAGLSAALPHDERKPPTHNMLDRTRDILSDVTSRKRLASQAVTSGKPVELSDTTTPCVLPDRPLGRRASAESDGLPPRKSCTKCGKEWPLSAFIGSTCPGLGKPIRKTCQRCVDRQKRYNVTYDLRHPGMSDIRSKARIRRCLSGKPRPPCQYPGCDQPSEFHHDDYDKPLETRDVCHAHHIMLYHKKQAHHGWAQHDPEFNPAITERLAAALAWCHARRKTSAPPPPPPCPPPAQEVAL